MKTKLFLIFSSIIITILITEIFLRISYKFFSDYNTEMFRYAAELKKPSNLKGVSHEHKKNVKAILMGKLHSINNQGLRDTKDIEITKKNKKRILFLGDSITFGWGVSDNETFCYLLNKKLNNKVEILNFGIGNYNTEMEKNLFFAKGIKFKPDTVILMFHPNDIEKNPGTTKLGYLIKSHSYLYGFLYGKFTNIFSLFGRDYIKYYKSLYTTKMKEHLKKQFKELKKECKKKNISLFVFIIPEMHKFKNYPFLDEHKYIYKICNENNIKYFDLLEEFKKYDPKSLWISKNDVHPNKKGHKIIANYIFLKLADQILQKDQLKETK